MIYISIFHDQSSLLPPLSLNYRYYIKVPKSQRKIGSKYRSRDHSSVIGSLGVDRSYKEIKTHLENELDTRNQVKPRIWRELGAVGGQT